MTKELVTETWDYETQQTVRKVEHSIVDDVERLAHLFYDYQRADYRTTVYERLGLMTQAQVNRALRAACERLIAALDEVNHHG